VQTLRFLAYALVTVSFCIGCKKNEDERIIPISVPTHQIPSDCSRMTIHDTLVGVLYQDCSGTPYANQPFQLSVVAPAPWQSSPDLYMPSGITNALGEFVLPYEYQGCIDYPDNVFRELLIYGPLHHRINLPNGAASVPAFSYVTDGIPVVLRFDNGGSVSNSDTVFVSVWGTTLDTPFVGPFTDNQLIATYNLPKSALHNWLDSSTVTIYWRLNQDYTNSHSQSVKLHHCASVDTAVLALP
jgi:hypothetical protein